MWVVSARSWGTNKAKKSWPTFRKLIMSQYIGKTISLISNKGLRYVGLLDNINAEDATVALKSVRSFGTEGRMAQAGNPAAEVMPGSDVYEYVVFRGSDVKDLSVLDTPIDEVKPDVYRPSFKEPPTQTAPAQAEPQATPEASAHKGTENTGEVAQPQPVSRPEPPRQSQKNDKPQPTKTRPTQSKRVEIPQEEFDFESANARFSRDEAEQAEESGGYNKLSSFFDTISSSTQQRGAMRWSEEKSLNMDTFGEASVRGRGRGRGRGWRGGRGNWRGGRGGRGRGRGSDYDKKPEWA